MDFERARKRCLCYGFVADMPEYFLMAVPVWRFILTHGTCTPAKPGDCWFIYGMAGDMVKSWEAEPYRLPWFAFERGKQLHIWPRDRIRALTSCHLVAKR